MAKKAVILINLLCNRENLPFTQHNLHTITYHASRLCNCVKGLYRNNFFYTVIFRTGTYGDGCDKRGLKTPFYTPTSPGRCLRLLHNTQMEF